MRARRAVAIVVLTGCAAEQKPPAPVDGNADRRAASPAVGASSPVPASVASTDPPAQQTGQPPTPAETRACTARGGTIQPVCMLGELTCVIRYRDGGKRCADKSDCLGECLYEGPDPPPPNATGTCQRTSDPCGCKAPVHHGQVEPTLCAD